MSDAAENFMARVEFEPNSGCWLWSGGLHADGYGTFWFRGKRWLAHRVSLELCGRATAGLDVLHSCDVRVCVNPKHLRVGTAAENARDRVARGRSVGAGPWGEAHGRAKLTQRSVDEIRRLAQAGEGRREIAGRFCVHPSVIGRIVRYDAWKFRSAPPPSPTVSRQKESLADRFFRFIEYDTNGGCWLWSGGGNQSGYGHLKIGNRTTTANRVSWRLFRGDPGRMHVLHRCDVRRCVNPEHLFLGTNADNVADKMRKGRGRWVPNRGERHGGAKLTEEQVIEIRQVGLAGVADSARRFGISRSHASDIIRRGRWKHLS